MCRRGVAARRASDKEGMGSLRHSMDCMSDNSDSSDENGTQYMIWSFFFFLHHNITYIRQSMNPSTHTRCTSICARRRPSQASSGKPIRFMYTVITVVPPPFDPFFKLSEFLHGLHSRLFPLISDPPEPFVSYCTKRTNVRS